MADEGRSRARCVRLTVDRGTTGLVTAGTVLALLALLTLLTLRTGLLPLFNFHAIFVPSATGRIPHSEVEGGAAPPRRTAFGVYREGGLLRSIVPSAATEAQVTLPQPLSLVQVPDSEPEPELEPEPEPAPLARSPFSRLTRIISSSVLTGSSWVRLCLTSGCNWRRSTISAREVRSRSVRPRSPSSAASACLWPLRERYSRTSAAAQASTDATIHTLAAVWLTCHTDCRVCGGGGGEGGGWQPAGRAELDEG